MIGVRVQPLGASSGPAGTNWLGGAPQAKHLLIAARPTGGTSAIWWALRATWTRPQRVHLTSGKAGIFKVAGRVVGVVETLPPGRERR